MRTTDPGVDARKALTGARVTVIAIWGEDASDTIDQQIARQEATRLAAAVKDADRHLHRLNRHSDRQLNMALDIIVKVRMVHDETTMPCTQRRTGEGRTYLEIKRALKRYIGPRHLPETADPPCLTGIVEGSSASLNR
jgi:hypothetical protein